MIQTPANPKENFDIDGFCTIHDLFSKKLVDNALKEVENKLPEILASEGTIVDIINNEKYLRYVPRPHHIIPTLYKFVSSSLLLTASELLGEEVYLIGMDLHCRHQMSTISTPPHQDSFLWCFRDGHESLVTCYLSLSGMDENTAALRFTKGSHKLPTLPHYPTTIRGFSSAICNSFNDLPSDLKEKESEVILKPGQAVFFDSKTIHYTNQSKPPKNSRVSLSIRLGGHSAQYCEKKKKTYLQNVQMNRSYSMKQGVTSTIPKPQHT